MMSETEKKREKINELAKTKTPMPPKYPTKVEPPQSPSEEKLQETSRMRKKKAQKELRAAIANFDPLKSTPSSKQVTGPRQSGMVT